MARGSLAGIVSGILVSGLALGVVSLNVPPVEMGGSTPVAGAQDPGMSEAEGGDAATADSGSEPAPDTVPDTMPETVPDTVPDAVPDTPEPPDPGEAPAASVEEAAPETEAEAEAEAAAEPEPEPMAEPVTGAETGADPASAPAQQDPPTTGEDTPKRGEAAETALTPQPTGTPLPETDRAPQMESDPVKAPMAAPTEPEAIPGTELIEKLPPALPAADAEETDASDPALTPDAEENLPDTAQDKAPGNALVTEPEPAPEPAPEPDAEPAPAAAPEPAAMPEPAAEAVTEPEPAPEAEPEAEPAAEIATIVAEPAEVSPPVVVSPPPVAIPAAEPEPESAPAPGLSGADNVVTGRLPTIGGDTAEPDQEPEAAAAVPADDLPAIERNRIDFAGAADQPLLALLLLDSGDRASLADIGKLPFPLTVAVDASAPDASEAIGFYAARGIEVALMLPLPPGATPGDVDTTVQAYRPLLDEAATVVVDAGLDFQALGPGAVQLATNLAETGHGLVSFPSGLNTGHKSALKLDVPAGLVFLDLDGDGQEGPVIRRFLDNAAFRARNEEGVIVLARTRAETLQALLEWSLGNRAQTVALAPISAVLLGE